MLAIQNKVNPKAFAILLMIAMVYYQVSLKGNMEQLIKFIECCDFTACKIITKLEWLLLSHVA